LRNTTGTPTSHHGRGRHAQEIDMQRTVADRIELHVARQNAMLLAANFEIETNGLKSRGVPAGRARTLSSMAMEWGLFVTVNHAAVPGLCDEWRGLSPWSPASSAASTVTCVICISVC